MLKTPQNLFRTRSRRSGVTVIEVLTSMIVAAIGVAGVLVMIPFAVQQSQRGIEKDVGDILGRNGYEDLRIRGYTEVADSGDIPWVGESVSTTLANPPEPSVTVTPTLGSALTPGIVHLDPHAVAAAFEERVQLGCPAVALNAGFPTTAWTARAIATQPNPDFLTKWLPNALKIPVSTLNRSIGALGSTGLQLSLAEARELVQGQDDLVFGENDFRGTPAADPDLAGPQAYYDVSNGGNPVTRQFRGKYSWSALMVPQRTAGDISQLITGPPPSIIVPPASEYKMYTLVYAERTVRESDGVATDVSAQPDMLAALVQRHPFVPSTDPLVPKDQRRAQGANPNNWNGGFVESVNRIVLGIPIANVAKDDWVMLINKKLPPNYANAPYFERSVPDASGTFSYPFDVDDTGYDTQVAFCRVQSIDPGADLNEDGDYDDNVGGVDERFPSLSVQGGAFDFYYEDLESITEIDAGTPDLVNPTLSAIGYVSDTWVVHLKNVVNVHERTITLE